MECQGVRVIVTESRGRGLAAARSVARGEELLVEPAAVAGPVQSDEICCVSCFRYIFRKIFSPRSDFAEIIQGHAEKFLQF